MATKTLKVGKGRAKWVRLAFGDEVVIESRGQRMTCYPGDDPVARDVAIAALMRLGLKGVEVARLTATSPAHVCEVGQRARAGGYAALARRGHAGRPSTLTGRQLKRVKELFEAGKSISRIAESVGASRSVVGRAAREMKLRAEVEQAPLAGVGQVGTVHARQETAARTIETIGTSPEEMTAPPAVPAEDVPTDGREVEGRTGSREEPGNGGDRPGLECGEEKDLREALADGPTNQEIAEGEVGIDDSTGDVSTTANNRPAVGDGRDRTGSDAAQGSDRQGELLPGEPLPPGPALHPTRYAGTILLCAAAVKIGVTEAIERAGVVRPEKSLYDAREAVLGQVAAWGAGYGSQEAMHERDARSFGVVLGLERSPSVRTMHRAIRQMRAVFDPIEWGHALMQGTLEQTERERLLFGVDGHVKPYSGKARIDKGWDSKRRLASPAIADVMVHDERGWTWRSVQVVPSDQIRMHLGDAARALRAAFAPGSAGGQPGQDTPARPIVLGFDRGGFDFDVLDELDGDSFSYIAWVPATVNLGIEKEDVAPLQDGVGEVPWQHPRLHHRTRLLVSRDGTRLLPAVTNLTTLVPAAEAMAMLRSIRGCQENGIKAARATVYLDHLVDRGVERSAPDDRPVSNPVRKEILEERREARKQLDCLRKEYAIPDGRPQREIREDLFAAEMREHALACQLRRTPKKVPRLEVDPGARREWLRTRNRVLLGPLKNATENARRWLLDTLGTSLAPTDKGYDQSARARTLLAVLRCGGTVRFGADLVEATLDLPLPPTAHGRLASALQGLDRHDLRFVDGRQLRFRLAPRPCRENLPSAPPAS